MTVFNPHTKSPVRMEVKRSQDTEDYEIILNRSSEVLPSPRKLFPDNRLTKVPQLDTINEGELLKGWLNRIDHPNLLVQG